jgi:integrase
MVKHHAVKRVKLTSRHIKALKPAPAGKRKITYDSVVPQMGYRSSGKGHAFGLVTRFPGSAHPTFHNLGKCGGVGISLEDAGAQLTAARKKANKWLTLIEAGVNPEVEADRERQAELRKQRHTFAAVAEEYLKRHVAGHRTAKDSERIIRKELIGPLGAKPVTEVSREDVTNVLLEIKDRPAPYQARIVYQHMQGLYAWAINVGTYGLEASPTDRIKPGLLIGEKKPRQRVLNDSELRAFWRATDKLGYPFGPLFQLLALTGCRKAEIGDASWAEIDLDKKLLTIPEERFKSGGEHLVPLSREAMAVLGALPRFGQGSYLFSTTSGTRPVVSFSRAKPQIDRLMAEDLGSLPKPFVVHDIRRTVRTRLSALRVPEPIAELVMGHGRKGLARVYDQHDHLDEMRDALELWSARLRSIVEPPPPNVLQLGDRASA